MESLRVADPTGWTWDHFLTLKSAVKGASSVAVKGLQVWRLGVERIEAAESQQHRKLFGKTGAKDGAKNHFGE